MREWSRCWWKRWGLAVCQGCRHRNGRSSGRPAVSPSRGHSWSGRTRPGSRAHSWKENKKHFYFKVKQFWISILGGNKFVNILWKDLKKTKLLSLLYKGIFLIVGLKECGLVIRQRWAGKWDKVDEYGWMDGWMDCSVDWRIETYGQKILCITCRWMD